METLVCCACDIVISHIREPARIHNRIVIGVLRADRHGTSREWSDKDCKKRDVIAGRRRCSEQTVEGGKLDFRPVSWKDCVKVLPGSFWKEIGWQTLKSQSVRTWVCEDAAAASIIVLNRPPCDVRRGCQLRVRCLIYCHGDAECNVILGM